MTQPEDATTSTMDLLKEMKEQMATLTSKVETLQQKQASDASLIVQEEEGNEDKNYLGVWCPFRSLRMLFWRRHSPPC